MEQDLDNLEQICSDAENLNLEVLLETNAEEAWNRYGLYLRTCRTAMPALISELREARRIIKTGSMIALDVPNAFIENAALREELAEAKKEIKELQQRGSYETCEDCGSRVYGRYSEAENAALRTEVEAMRGVGTYDPCIGCTISPVDCLGSASCHIYALKQMRRETLRKRSVDELIDRLEAAEEGLEKFSPLIEAARDLCMGQFTDSEYGYCCVRDGDYEELREALAALDKGKEGA